MDAGADWAARPGSALRSGGLQDVVFITAMGGLDLAVDLVAPGGSIVLYSAFDPEAKVSVAADRAHREEVSIVGVYNQEPEDWEAGGGHHPLGHHRGRTRPARLRPGTRCPLVDEALALVTSRPTHRVFVETGPGLMPARGRRRGGRRHGRGPRPWPSMGRVGWWRPRKRPSVPESLP